MKLFWHIPNFGTNQRNDLYHFSILYAKQILKVPLWLEISTIDDFSVNNWNWSIYGKLPHLLYNSVDKLWYHNIINHEISYRIKEGDSIWSLFENRWEEVFKSTKNEQFRLKNPNPNIITPGCFIKDTSEQIYDTKWCLLNKLFGICRYLYWQSKYGDLIYVDKSILTTLPSISDKIIYNKEYPDIMYCPMNMALDLHQLIINGKNIIEACHVEPIPINEVFPLLLD